MFARQSTAKTVAFGPVLDSAGVAVTDVVVGDVKVSKAGAAFAALNGSTTLTHDGDGFYRLASAAGDYDTVGTVEFRLADAGTPTNTAPMTKLFVVEEAIYDALFAASATGLLPADVTAISGDSGAADNLETMLDGTGGQTLSLGRLVVANPAPGTAVTVSATNGTAVSIASGSVGAGVSITGADYSPGLSITTGAGGNANGVTISGQGTGHGVQVGGGATGVGLRVAGGSTSGRGVYVTTTNGDAIELDPTGSGKVSLKLTDGFDSSTLAAIAAAVLAAGDVDGYTLEQTLKLCLAALAGKLSGAATTTATIRAADDSRDRITATVDASGNRTAVTLDANG